MAFLSWLQTIAFEMDGNKILFFILLCLRSQLVSEYCQCFYADSSSAIYCVWLFKCLLFESLVSEHRASSTFEHRFKCNLIDCKKIINRNLQIVRKTIIGWNNPILHEYTLNAGARFAICENILERRDTRGLSPASVLLYSFQIHNKWFDVASANEWVQWVFQKTFRLRLAARALHSKYNL